MHRGVSKSEAVADLSSESVSQLALPKEASSVPITTSGRSSKVKSPFLVGPPSESHSPSLAGPSESKKIPSPFLVGPQSKLTSVFSLDPNGPEWKMRKELKNLLRQRDYFTVKKFILIPLGQ